MIDVEAPPSNHLPQLVPLLVIECFASEYGCDVEEQWQIQKNDITKVDLRILNSGVLKG